MQSFRSNGNLIPPEYYVVLILLGMTLLFLSSCATPGISTETTKTTTVPEDRLAKPGISRSDDYMVYRMQGDETPALLAERFLGEKEKSWVIEEANEGTAFEKGQMIVIPLKEQNKGGLFPSGYQIVPILCYHQFSEACKSQLCVPIRVFEQQMRYLKENGYKSVTLGQLMGFFQYRHGLPKKSVVITIDDGYKSVYNLAYPVLKKYGFKATLFVYTDFTGVAPSAMSWDQLNKLKADGFEVGSHTMSHCDLTQKREGEDEAAFIDRINKEITVSKQIIDENLGQDTIYMAFPYGKYSPRILKLCEEAGYKMGFSVNRGGNPFFTDPLVVRRDQVLKRDMESFGKRVKTFKAVSLE